MTKTTKASRAVRLAAGLALLTLAGCQSGPSGSDPSPAAGAAAALLERKVEFLEGLAAERRVAARVVADLVSALPGRVRLTEISYGGVEVAAKGVAPTNNLLADYLARLAGSAALSDVMLRSSSQKSARSGDYQEFALQAVVRPPDGGAGPDSGETDARLAALERLVGGRGGPGEILRELQMLALGSGLQMTRFAPGNELAGEFYAEWPVTIEVAGSLDGVGRYLDDLAGLSRLWVVEKLSLKAASPQDARSPLRATVSARAYLPR